MGLREDVQYPQSGLTRLGRTVDLSVVWLPLTTIPVGWHRGLELCTATSR